MTRTMIMMTAIVGFQASAQSVTPPANLTAEVACEVLALEPQNANFFSFGRTPRTGDKISLDLSGKEIDELRFESGARIPLKEINAKLTDAGSRAGFARFRGTHKGVQGGYIGLLFGFLNETEKTGNLTIQVLQESSFQGLRVHSLNMKCSITN